ncbi:MAG: hypothetical protein QW255_05100 [Candidatus Bilamarchaeaceae archaeon]
MNTAQVQNSLLENACAAAQAGKKVLVNISNHPSSSWSSAQQDRWDCIYDIPFPSIPADWDTKNVQDLVVCYGEALCALPKQVVICLQGEYTFTLLLGQFLKGKGYTLAIPTTNRIAETLPDGRQVSRFVFTRWRLIQ